MTTEELEQQFNGHLHSGTDTKKVALGSIDGVINYGSTVPAYSPSSVQDQIYMYLSGSTKRLYIYDFILGAWNYISINDGVTTETGAGWYGNGQDGDVTISGATSLTRDMYYNDLTIDASQVLSPAGYKIFVKGTLTVNGTIQNNGGNGGNGGNFGILGSYLGNSGSSNGGNGGSSGNLLSLFGNIIWYLLF